jgi:transposase-like protein
MRPSKLTPKVRGRIEQAVSAGASYSAAAQYVGVAESTLHSWLARGRAERDARKHEPTERRFVLLLDAVERASARAEVRAAATIAEAQGADWRAAAWFLERRAPQDWAPPRLRLEHAMTTPDALLSELLDQCTDEELEILQDVAARSRRSQS